MKEPQQKTVSVIMPETMLAELLAGAKKEERALSAHIRKILSDHLATTRGSSVKTVSK